MLAMDRNTIGI